MILSTLLQLKRRWWILILLCNLISHLNVLWYSYGAIGNTASIVLGLSESYLNVMIAIIPGVYTVLILLSSWILNKFGARLCAVFGATCLALCGVIRCFATSPQHLWIAFASQVLVAMASCVVIPLPPVVSAAWFPPEQRTLATTAACLSGNLGSSITFFLSLMVKQPDDMMKYMYIQAAMGALVAIPIYIYFPSAPPSPPSITASLRKSRTSTYDSSAPLLSHVGSTNINGEVVYLSFLSSLRELLLNGSFILTSLSAGIATGALIGLVGVLNPVLISLGYDPETVGWLGVIGSLVGVFAGLVTFKLAEWIRSMKLLIALSYLFAFVGYGFFSLQLTQWPIKWPTPLWALALSISFGSFGVSVAVAVSLEFAAEITYPVAEELSSSLLNFMIYFFATALTVVSVLASGKVVAFVFFACNIIPLVLFMFTKNEARRMATDKRVTWD